MATADLASKVSQALHGAQQPVVYRAELRTIPFVIREVAGTEALSTPFRFEARFVTLEGDLLEPSSFVGNTAGIWIEREGEVVRRVSGVVTEASLGATARGAPELHAVIEPRLALLRHKSNQRVFRDKTVPEIVAEVLLEAHIGCENRLNGAYKRRPYTVQFRETDLEFVSRLLEDEGIFYAFPDLVANPPKDVIAEHAILIGDSIGAYEPIEGDPHLAYHAGSQLERDVEAVISISRKAKMAPGKVMLRDWNLEKPSLPMDVTAEVKGASKATFYDYPGKYELPAEGERKAKLVAEAFACEASVVKGRADVPRMTCGRTFDLVDGPRAFEGAYVITELVHAWRLVEGTTGGASAPARNELAFTALPAGVTFRPPRVTAPPVITNPLTAFVTGPEGEDIHTDEFGRVKVIFPWDRYQLKDDHASHWVPVLQDNTGSSSAIPRVGWEVVVNFVEGDPDRPFILGRVYNGIDQFPDSLPGGKTKSALRSLSSPGRDGQNEIWIDDKAGSELVAVQAEKDQNVVVANDKKEDVLNTEANTVVLDETIVIGANNTVTVGQGQRLVVDGNQSTLVAGSRSRKVGTTEEIGVKGNRNLKIGGMHMRKVGGFDNVGAKSIKETIGAVAIEASLKDNATTAAALDTLTVGGAVVEIAGQGKIEDTQMLRVETIGMMLYTRAKAMFSLTVGGKRSTTIGAGLYASAATIALKAGKAFTAKITGGVDIAGSDGIVIKSGGSEVNFTAGGITMKSDQDIVISATGASTLAAAEAKHDV